MKLLQEIKQLNNKIKQLEKAIITTGQSQINTVDLKDIKYVMAEAKLKYLISKRQELLDQKGELRNLIQEEI